MEYVLGREIDDEFAQESESEEEFVLHMIGMGVLISVILNVSCGESKFLRQN